LTLASSRSSLKCGRCLENARWERIYQEKFVDPDYYVQTSSRRSSPLSGL